MQCCVSARRAAPGLKQDLGISLRLVRLTPQKQARARRYKPRLVIEVVIAANCHMLLSGCIDCRESMMADNKKKRGGADRALIALNEKYEVAYWAKKLKVTPAKLKYAVKKVGHSAKKVEAYIKLQKHRASDKSRIALSEPYEVRYWTKKFKVTPAKLRAAVAAAGHSSKRVEAYLASRKATKKKAMNRKKAA